MSNPPPPPQGTGAAGDQKKVHPEGFYFTRQIVQSGLVSDHGLPKESARPRAVPDGGGVRGRRKDVNRAQHRIVSTNQHPIRMGTKRHCNGRSCHKGYVIYVRVPPQKNQKKRACRHSIPHRVLVAVSCTVLGSGIIASVEGGVPLRGQLDGQLDGCEGDKSLRSL